MKKAGIVVALVSVLLGGCAAVGNEKLRTETEASVSTRIVEGKTTKQEVKAMFGSPAKATFTDGGLEVWNFEFEKMSADVVNYIPVVNLFGSSASGKKKQLVVMFDTTDVVKRFSMSESDVSRKTGLFNN